MMAGISEMPLQHFLSATLLGKGFVKAPLQTMFIIMTTQKIMNVDTNMWYFENVELFITFGRYLGIIVMCITTWFTIESIENSEMNVVT